LFSPDRGQQNQSVFALYAMEWQRVTEYPVVPEFHVQLAIQLITETHGASALNLALQHKPDLILLDLNLPDIHGSEVLGILHDNEKTASIPVVVISADARPPQIEELTNLGVQNYLTKPIDILYFLKIIDEFIKDRNSRS